jgi:hypothetical protein
MLTEQRSNSSTECRANSKIVVNKTFQNIKVQTRGIDSNALKFHEMKELVADNIRRMPVAVQFVNISTHTKIKLRNIVMVF